MKEADKINSISNIKFPKGTAVRNTLAKVKERKTMNVESIEAEYDAIPNPGVNSNQRLVVVSCALLLSIVLAVFVFDWPELFMANFWGPFVFDSMFTLGVFLLLPLKKNAFEMAIAEFGDLGLKPALIGEVIVENRAKAFSLLDAAPDIQSSVIKNLVVQIGKEALDIIKGFSDDPSDVQRSRSVLNTTMDQSLKIVGSYINIEGRKAAMDRAEFDNLYRQTEESLQSIKNALEEQHRRNLDNNTTALEVDIKVSNQLLNS